MWTEEEEIAILKDKITKIKCETFDTMRSFIHMSEVELYHCGYKTREIAIVTNLQYGVIKIEKLNKEFAKKFPD